MPTGRPAAPLCRTPPPAPRAVPALCLPLVRGSPSQPLVAPLTTPSQLRPPGVIQAMHTAVKEGHVEVVSVLLQCGTPVEARDSDGQTALHLAALVRVCAGAVCAVNSHSPVRVAHADMRARAARAHRRDAPAPT
eukprot:9351450-Pyramimonas_sp.AAC.2